MGHPGHLSNLKSQFMETEAWHSFVSESLYDDDSGDSGSRHQVLIYDPFIYSNSKAQSLQILI